MQNKIKTFTFFLILISFFLSSCGKKDQTEQTTPGGETGDVSKTEGQTNPEKKEGDKTGLDIKEGLPADYPSDIPKPIDSKCLGSLQTSEGIVVTFESTAKPKDILETFASEIEKNGYKKDENEMMSEKGGMALWKKDKKEVSIMLAWDDTKSITSAVITY